MKFLTAQLAFVLDSGSSRRNLRLLSRFVLLLILLVTIYTVLFHVIMEAEERGGEHSWLTGLYWTLTVMSTLGFGDITFHSDLGRMFSIVVLVSGVMFLLIVLPFTFIEFFYAPWLNQQRRSRAPREVPEEVQGHVLLAEYDPVSQALIDRLKSYGKQYFLLEPDLTRALELYDQGLSVVVGDRDDVETYRRLRAAAAAMVVATSDDHMNSNIAFTVREVSETVPIVAFARAPESVDVLKLAGSSHVLQLTEMLGRSLARRTVAGDSRTNVIGRFGELLIAEAPVVGTPMVGRTLGHGWVREATGLTVVGLWQRGHFHLPTPDRQLEPTTMLVLAGSQAQLDAFSELTAIYNLPDAPVLILGGGRVGRAAAQALEKRGITFRIVEQDASRVKMREHTTIGSAADYDVLQEAGIELAPTTIVTTSDDATNIYLTIYVRRLRPDMQIISRSNLERNVSTLHRAGADFVMSYASMGANAAFNILEQDDVVMVAEGLDVFRTPVPPALAGHSLRSASVRELTGCSVVAIEQNGRCTVNPEPNTPITSDPSAELIIIGSTDNERRFLETFFPGDRRKKARKA
ncbi:MAG TPA: NAD-binding protein [Longimicrobiales bacterium]|nr:NAD-binding protein [Longimicrobiales bacterium]